MFDRDNPEDFWLELDPDKPLDPLPGPELDAVVTLPAPELRSSIDDVPPIDRD